jgi:hypothetical protein
MGTPLALEHLQHLKDLGTLPGFEKTLKAILFLMRYKTPAWHKKSVGETGPRRRQIRWSIDRETSKTHET